MKRGVFRFTCLFLLLLLLLPAALVADEATMNLVSRVLESFDPDDQYTDWFVNGSKFSTEGYPRWVVYEGYPEALFGRNKDGVKRSALGVNTMFDRQGLNFVEIIPAVKNDEGKWVPNPIPIPGRAKSIDMWVLGSNYKYSIEIHLSDYRGVTHVLPLGNLNYIGWKNLTAEIPSNIPQSIRYVPHYKGLTLEKLVLWTRPTERVNDYYVWIDQIKVLTDIFESPFDGQELYEADNMEDIWANAEGGE